MKFTKYTRFTEIFRIRRNLQNQMKIFKDATYQRSDSVIIRVLQKHGYKEGYGGESSVVRDQVCRWFGDGW